VDDAEKDDRLLEVACLRPAAPFLAIL